ncbi:MAG: SGNH/GDSL hydrolase family protein [Planctomycetota bacterium]|nr:MAG: SGNH/GDSL hydrolase family protein [Planctomycetota bacterium]
MISPDDQGEPLGGHLRMASGTPSGDRFNVARRHRVSNPRRSGVAQVPKRVINREKRRLFAAAACGLGVVGALIIAELALRVHVAWRGWTPNCYVTGLAFFVPDAEAGYTLRPGLRIRSTTYDISVNSLGLRGPEIRVAKAPGRVRIAVLGGSAVFGYLVADAEDPCRILERELQGRGWQVEVINAGVPGYNLTQCRARYESVVAPLQPDIVLIYAGWNDIPTLIASDPAAVERTAGAPPLWQRCLSHSVLYGFLRYRLFPPPAPRFAPPPSAGTTVSDAGAALVEQEYRRLIEAVERSGARLVLSTQLHAGCENCSGVTQYLGDSPAQVETNQQIARWLDACVRRLAHEGDLPLVEICGTVPCNQRTLGDAIHPTAEGYRQIVARWVATLERLLSETSESSQEDGA